MCGVVCAVWCVWCGVVWCAWLASRPGTKNFPACGAIHLPPTHPPSPSTHRLPPLCSLHLYTKNSPKKNSPAIHFPRPVHPTRICPAPNQYPTNRLPPRSSPSIILPSPPYTHSLTQGSAPIVSLLLTVAPPVWPPSGPRQSLHHVSPRNLLLTLPPKSTFPHFSNSTHRIFPNFKPPRINSPYSHYTTRF